MIAQDTHISPTPFKHTKTISSHGSLLSLQYWSTIQANKTLLVPRVRNTMRAREQCSPESFCASGIFLRLELFLANCLIFENLFALFSGMSGRILIFFLRVSDPSRLFGRFPENLDWFQKNTPESPIIIIWKLLQNVWKVLHNMDCTGQNKNIPGSPEYFKA